MTFAFAASLKSVRILHRCLGLFFAPMILLVAITGGLQMFGLHETARGSSYVPPKHPRASFTIA